MKVDDYLKRMVFTYFDNRYNAQLRSSMKTREFSIICSNCIGGIIYHRLGVEFQSPTVNQFMRDDDFLKFITNMDYYLNLELKDNGTDGKYPLGLLGDIPIEFTHYASARDAINAWERRKKRIRYDKLYFILYDTIDGMISRDDIRKFGELKCANRIVLTKNSYPDVDYALTIPLRKSDENRHYMNRNFIGRRRYEEQFDFVSWINTGQNL